MKKITDLFTDLFDVEKVTDFRLFTFGHDTLDKMKENKPGTAFDTIITETDAALDDFGNAVEAEGGNLGDRKGLVKVKNQSRVAFHEFISEKEGLIRSTFGKESLAYTQFFPKGLSSFGDSETDVKFMAAVSNIVNRTTQYSADLTAAFIAEVGSKASAYESSIGAVSTEKGQVSGSSEAVLAKRKLLTTQLTKNALTIALFFLAQPEKEKVYFNTSLLFAAKRKHIAKGKPAAGATEKVHDIKVYEEGKRLHMKNKGATILSFQFWLNGVPVGNSFTVDTGKEVDKQFKDFFSNADAIYVTNHGTGIGEYEVDELA